MSLFIQYIPAQERCQKEKPIHSRILGICESILLFCLFFLPALIVPSGEAIHLEFNTHLIIRKLFFIDIPGALICLLLLARNTPCSEFALKLPSFYEIRLLPLFVALLLGLALSINVIESALNKLCDIFKHTIRDSQTVVKIVGPIGIWQWIVCIAGSLGTAFIEESFFRSHLLSRLRQAGLPKLLRIIISSLVFAICHVYLGISPMIFSLIAGIILAYFFEKGSSLYLLILSHTSYNILSWIQISL